MKDLATFLRERLDEEERVALDARPGLWSVVHHPGGWESDEQDSELIADGKLVARFGPRKGGPSCADHVERWSPARVLAEVEAKRKLIDALIEMMIGDYAPWNEDYLRMLALSYRDHPDWREEWAA